MNNISSDELEKESIDHHSSELMGRTKIFLDFKSHGLESLKGLGNLSLFIEIFCYDFIISMHAYRKAYNGYVRIYHCRLMILHVFEFTNSIHKNYKHLQDLLGKFTSSTQKGFHLDELKQSKKDIDIRQNNNNNYLREMRKKLIAHREPDMDLFLMDLFSFDLEKVTSLMVDYYILVNKFSTQISYLMTNILKLSEKDIRALKL